MKRIALPMHRYGQPDFDRSYLQWGFHDRDTQVQEAQAVLDLLSKDRPLRILDLACGKGTHLLQWARRGHRVTGVDLSETFLAEAREEATREGLAVPLVASDIKGLAQKGAFDVVTWIERSFWDEEILQAIYRYLDADGVFVFDDRNPEHPKVLRRASNWRNWREEDGKFHLERHETDEAGLRHDCWIEIDPRSDTITERSNVWPVTTLEQRMGMLKNAGFQSVELRTMTGQPFQGGSDDYWLWILARKRQD